MTINPYQSPEMRALWDYEQSKEWTVGHYLSNGNVAVLSGSKRFSSEEFATAEACRRNREKPFLIHVAVRA